jgi:hypothetical protein
VLRHLARRLLALLLLLALIAGGQSSGVMAMSMDAMSMDMGKMQTGDMDQGCKACGAPIAAPCDIVCAALPALDVAAFRVEAPGLQERWSNRSESGISIFIRPDTSPPRV